MFLNLLLSFIDLVAWASISSYESTVGRINQPPARVQPNWIPFDSFNATCYGKQNRLTEEEASVCELWSRQSQGFVLLDFVAQSCGYEVDCALDPDRNDWTFGLCPSGVGAGVLFDTFAEDALSYVKIGGSWLAARKTLSCLSRQQELTKHMRFVGVFVSVRRYLTET
jgi:hypothetical protein